MKNLSWKRIFIVILPINILSFALGMLLTKTSIILGVELGVYSISLATKITYFILVPLTILISSVVVAVRIQENRLKHFFTAFLLAVAVNILTYGGMYAYEKIRDRQTVQQGYKDYPYLRPIDDSKRTISIISPANEDEITASPITVTVYAKEGTFVGTQKVVLQEYGGDAKILGEDDLMIQRHLSPDGRNVYQAVVPFVFPKTKTPATIEVKGFDDFSVSVNIFRPIRTAQENKTQTTDKVIYESNFWWGPCPFAGQCKQILRIYSSGKVQAEGRENFEKTLSDKKVSEVMLMIRSSGIMKKECKESAVTDVGGSYTFDIDGVKKVFPAYSSCDQQISMIGIAMYNFAGLNFTGLEE